MLTRYQERHLNDDREEPEPNMHDEFWAAIDECENAIAAAVDKASEALDNAKAPCPAYKMELGEAHRKLTEAADALPKMD